MGSIAYGNARVRARKSRLLGERDYAALLRPGDLDGLIAELSARPDYRPEVEASLARFAGIRRLDEALRRHLSNTLRAVVGWYRGSRRGERLSLLLERWELRNLRTLFRALARLAPAEDVLGLLVPVGRLDEAALHTLASSDGVRDALERLVVWGLPTPDVARRLFRVFPAYEASRGDVRVFERALDDAWAERVAAVPEGGLEPEVAAAVRGPVDRANLDVALRLREARRRGEPTHVFGEPFAVGGLVPPARFADARDAESREQAASRLAAARPLWRGPLAVWVGDGDAVALADALDAQELRAAVAGFWRSDPLSLGIPIAYLAAKEHELQSLRRLGRGLVDGLPPDQLELEVRSPW